MPCFDLGKKPAKKDKINSKNGNEKSQRCCENHNGAEKCGGRLDVKGLHDSTLRKGEHRSGHSASRAGQAIFLLEAAIAKPPTRVDVVMGHEPGQYEETDDG